MTARKSKKKDTCYMIVDNKDKWFTGGYHLDPPITLKRMLDLAKRWDRIIPTEAPHKVIKVKKIREY